MPLLDPSHLLTLLGGAALAGAGFLLRRIITGAGRKERIDSFAGVTDIVAKLRQHGLTPAEVQEMAVFIAGKQRGRPTGEAPSGQMQVKSADDEDDKPQSYWTQGAMNGRAWASAHVADAQLQQALLELEHYAEDGELAQVQAAWEAYRDKQVSFAGNQFAGGSMASGVCALEREALTLQRLAWVTSEVADRRSR